MISVFKLSMRRFFNARNGYIFQKFYKLKETIFSEISDIKVTIFFRALINGLFRRLILLFKILGNDDLSQFLRVDTD